MPETETPKPTDDEAKFKPNPNRAAEEYDAAKLDRYEKLVKDMHWDPEDTVFAKAMGEFAKKRLEALKAIDQEEAIFLAKKRVHTIARRDEALLSGDKEEIQKAQVALNELDNLLEKKPKKIRYDEPLEEENEKS